MSTRRDRNQGITLIELLIVLAIVGLLTSVAIPFVFQAGLLSGNKSSLAGRELFNMLRAAKVYAGTYNVDTALAYSVRTVDDSFTGENVGIVDAVGLVRRLKRGELQALADELGVNLRPLGLDDEDELYVPVGTGQTTFNFIANQSCILGNLFFDPDGFAEDSALKAIIILDPGLDRNVRGRMVPRLNANLGVPNPQGLFMDDASDSRQYLFPAHVFNPSGEVTGTMSKQRVKIRVGPLPTADPDDRFVDSSIVDRDNVRDPANLVHSEITLYTAIGRVKVTS